MVEKSVHQIQISSLLYTTGNSTLAFTKAVLISLAETRNILMSWNPNADQGQDPNSQYGQYSGYNPNQQPPPPQPTDPYSGQQSGYGQYGQAGGYNPQSGQPGSYG